MFEVHGVPPFGGPQRKIAERADRKSAGELAENLKGHGYNSLRVIEVGPSPAVETAESEAESESGGE